ncbi:MAG: adenosylcobinamide amidohydrolase [Coriobacteriia bacterium]|nr:adenosylcobinamide amidohydrolase [Coriobacteriia bacterium]
MLLTVLCTNEEVHFYKQSIVLFFNGNRKVISTGPHNGGYRENLTAVFNNDGTVGAGMASPLLAPTYEEHMVIRSEQLGLDAATVTGISTAAQMENVSIKSETYKDITVTAIVTGGVETNGGRVGDPASYDELEGKSFDKPAHGTINIILHINVDLTEGALARAIVTCTEAKTAALQELMAPSRYSIGLATGSGTDSTIVIANSDSPIKLSNSGKHCKLGELIGLTVKAAVSEALFFQTGLSPESQHDVIKRVSRFGITEDLLFERYITKSEGTLNRAQFADQAAWLMRQGSLVSTVSLYAHLIDQMTWGLLSIDEAKELASELLKIIKMPPLVEQDTATTMECLHQLTNALIEGLVQKMIKPDDGDKNNVLQTDLILCNGQLKGTDKPKGKENEAEAGEEAEELVNDDQL